MLNQSKKLNTYHKLLMEELSQGNESKIRESERKIEEIADHKITKQLQTLNHFKENIDNFIKVFSTDVQYDLKNLEKKIISSCKSHFLSKEDIIPKNANNKNSRYEHESHENSTNFKKELENMINENIQKSMKIIYDDINYIQNNNEMKFQAERADFEKMKDTFFEILKGNTKELAFLKKNFREDFNNLNDCFSSKSNFLSRK